MEKKHKAALIQDVTFPLTDNIVNTIRCIHPKIRVLSTVQIVISVAKRITILKTKKRSAYSQTGYPHILLKEKPQLNN